ncbi:Scn8a, partial [Symbiodinium pilosum]
ASGWKRAAKKIQAAAAMKIASPTQTVKSETGSSVAASPGRSTADSAFNSQAGKIRKRLAFLRASTADVDRQFFFPQIGHFWRDVFNRLHSSVSWILHLEEPERTSCLAKLIAHKTFEAIVMLAVLANTVFIAVQTNFEMETLGQTYASGPFVETVFLIFFTVEIVLRLLVHRLYFFCNEDMSWNLMDLVLMLLAYMDIFFEYYNVQVGRVGMLRLLRVTRLFRIMRVLRFLKEVRVMLVAIVGSFISLFWALGMLAVIIFIFAIYFMQQMTAYLQITPQEDELWSLQWDYFHNTGSAMYVLLMASTGGKDWEEVYQLVAPLGADCAIAFTFYLLFFTLGVMNIITGVFVENASVLFKPDDQEALAEYMKQVQDDIQEVTAIMHTIDTDGSGSLSVDEFLTAMQNDRVEHALRQIGVDIRMPEHYFKTLAAITEQEEIAIDEFVAHIVQMKGAASRTDVQTLTLEVAMLQTHGCKPP